MGTFPTCGKDHKTNKKASGSVTTKAGYDTKGAPHGAPVVRQVCRG